VQDTINYSLKPGSGFFGSVSVSAFLCFSGIYICHRDSETQKCGIPSEKWKIQTEALPIFCFCKKSCFK